MRIDKYLKVSRLIKRRSVANEACAQGRVSLNGKVAKAGAEVSPGDVVALRMGSRIWTLRVTNVNEHATKEQSSEMYELLEETTS